MQTQKWKSVFIHIGAPTHVASLTFTFVAAAAADML